LGYGDESHLKQRLDVVILVDRGYHVDFIKIGLRCKKTVGVSFSKYGPSGDGTRRVTGDVFTFIATMEFKHKSVVATQQEARRIRSEILKEDRVVVLNLLLEDDVAVFRSAIPNINYRCQVFHECVTCKTEVGCYAVASSLKEYVLIVIVPPPISEAYMGFCECGSQGVLGLAFIPTTDDFDRTLSRMPRYGNRHIAWGYAKDEETVHCRLGIMMDL
jgi:hypothetical protein